MPGDHGIFLEAKKWYFRPAMSAATVYNQHMTWLKDQGLYGMVHDVMHRMRTDTRSPPPDRVTFNIAIDACGRRDDLDEMERTLALMREAGIVPDVRTFTSMLSAYARNRQGIQVLDTFERFTAMGVRPNERTYSVLEHWVVPVSVAEGPFA